MKSILKGFALTALILLRRYRRAGRGNHPPDQRRGQPFLKRLKESGRYDQIVAAALAGNYAKPK